MQTETLYVLDFSNAEVHMYQVEVAQTIEEIEEFISDQGHLLKSCEYMYGDIEFIKHY